MNDRTKNDYYIMNNMNWGVSHFITIMTKRINKLKTQNEFNYVIREKLIYNGKNRF